jgi:hypothetical protein
MFLRLLFFCINSSFILINKGSYIDTECTGNVCTKFNCASKKVKIMLHVCSKYGVIVELHTAFWSIALTPQTWIFI